MEEDKMSLFRVTVEYGIEEVANAAPVMSEDFFVQAEDVQMAKYFYHKYTHENYTSVDRSEEIDHIHGIGETLEHGIREIAEVDYVNGLSHLRKV
jgi:hypothetical protein